MKKNVVILFAFLLLCAAKGQTTTTAGDSAQGDSGQFDFNAFKSRADFWRTNLIQSYSRQFMVYVPQGNPFRPRLSGLSTNDNLLVLQPSLLAVSCERIKQGLYRELDAPPAAWQGKIFLYLYPAASANERIPVVREKFANGWDYRVQLPDVLERHRFARTIVEILLLEMANRHAEGRSAEIPAWLAEGLAQELLASNEAQFILPPPQGNGIGVAANRINTNAPMLNPIERAQNRLRNQPPLTLEELSWPNDEQAAGIYQSSAQLFVHQLLGLKDGPAKLRAMINSLPDYYNWQLALLHAFRPDFQSQRDLEKWWALQLVQFTGRDLMQLWRLEESLNKLDDVLRLRIEVRTGRNELPLHTDINLQTVIRDWDRPRQIEALRRKLGELGLLRMRTAQDLVSLVDDYRRVIATYLERRDNSGYISSKIQITPGARLITEETLKQLDALDSRRESLRSARQQPLAAVEADPAPATVHQPPE